VSTIVSGGTGDDAVEVGREILRLAQGLLAACGATVEDRPLCRHIVKALDHLFRDHRHLMCCAKAEIGPPCLDGNDGVRIWRGAEICVRYGEASP
jgi:hypothetical protein